MPQAVPLYGFHRLWRWSAIGGAFLGALLALSREVQRPR